MSTHVDSISSEVVAEPEPAPCGGGQEQPCWQRAEALTWLSRRLELIRERTRAEGFDD